MSAVCKHGLRWFRYCERCEAEDPEMIALLDEVWKRVGKLAEVMHYSKEQSLKNLIVARARTQRGRQIQAIDMMRAEKARHLRLRDE
jgi:hypothetical protein